MMLVKRAIFYALLVKGAAGLGIRKRGLSAKTMPILKAIIYTLVADTDDARRVIEALGSKTKHVKGDVFEAKDRPNVPESKKPTEAQQRARLENLKKAQQARRTRTAKKE